MSGFRSTLAAIVAGAVLGTAALVGLLACGGEFREVEVYRPLAPDAQRAVWWKEHEARAKPHVPFPDPPGEGPVVKATYWLTRAIYPMEVRRRGDRFALNIHGVDSQVGGGAWTAHAEGYVTGPADTFAGATATITWSCLGVTYHHGSDGVGRLVFSDDGREVSAVYSVNEDPGDWAKAYGRVAEGEAPPYGSLRGQIPILPSLARLSDEREYRVAVVVRETGGAPIADAVAALKGVPGTRAGTDAEGRAVLRFLGRQAPHAQEFSAAAPGYRTASRVLFTGDVGYAETDSASPPLVEVFLDRVDRADHPEYRWVNPSPSANADDVMACGTCHSWQYSEWITTRHARSADNGHVAFERDRMVAWSEQTGVETVDDCRGCHQPADAVDRPGGGWSPRGPLAAVHCDLCHKVAALEDVEASGVFGALRVVRPDPVAPARPGSIGHVVGTSADVVYGYMGASYGPHLAASEFCAGCHQGGGSSGRELPKLDTWAEWKAWVAAGAGGRFRTCQECHMEAGTTYAESGEAIDQVAWNALHRGAKALHSHRFEATGALYASKSLDLSVRKTRDGSTGEWVVVVTLKNVDVGHKVPTGTWSKQVAVGVWARAGDRWLRQVGGDRARLVPEAADAPPAALPAGDWRNPAGFVLRVRPASGDAGASAAFWAPWAKADVVDERLAPGGERTATLRFEPSETEPQVEVQVVHRRGDLGAGPATTPWTLRAGDAPPQTLWMRVVR